MPVTSACFTISSNDPRADLTRVFPGYSSLTNPRCAQFQPRTQEGCRTFICPTHVLVFDRRPFLGDSLSLFRANHLKVQPNALIMQQARWENKLDLALMRNQRSDPKRLLGVGVHSINHFGGIINVSDFTQEMGYICTAHTKGNARFIEQI
ncbi:hypothetical protein BDV28DRAFT_49898 [Aspergillus coremiiformis]|uniref:Uncharacterized protein n=1 Tax=Aspergillus coremiiformis TaxID=138285 RepID=A0A5N6YX35_9EURO|nr:hypothetical protein BDV28DRAFT_49898 [Aspergillus coremiiformis]